MGAVGVGASAASFKSSGVSLIGSEPCLLIGGGVADSGFGKEVLALNLSVSG